MGGRTLESADIGNASLAGGDRSGSIQYYSCGDSILVSKQEGEQQQGRITPGLLEGALLRSTWPLIRVTENVTESQWRGEPYLIHL